MDKINKVLFLLISIIYLSSCTHENNSINIAVASNFESTLKEIVHRYKLLNPDTEINIISGSSGVLANQIINNAPFDLFLSADIDKPNKLIKQLKLNQVTKIYAIGQLALWIPNAQGHECLSQLTPQTTLAIANPKTAPYGQVALKILNKNNIRVKKMVHTSNVVQAYIYTQDQLTDAGFISYSKIINNIKGCVQVIDKNELKQGIILLHKQAKGIYEFILSDNIQALIAKSGYKISS